MRAARWHGRNDIRVETVPDPTPGPGDVVIRIGYCGVCGTDLEEYRHGPIWVPVGEPNPLTGAAAPVVMGHEFAGEIVAVGSGVERLKVGDHVAPDIVIHCGRCYWCLRHQVNLCQSMAALGLSGDGGLAEYCRAPAWMCEPIPPGLSDAAGALAEPLAVAVRAVRRARLAVGETVAVVGCGAVGLLAVQAARAGGAGLVFAVERSPARKELARQVGAAAVFDPRDQDVGDELRTLTGGVGPDVVIESAGAPGSWVYAATLVRRGGRVVVIGLSSTPSPVNVTETLVAPEIELIGSLAHVYDEDFRAAVRLLGDGRVDAERIISHRVPLERVVEDGLHRLETAKDETLKIVVKPGAPPT
jgi:(R,R)-butanediol dehydrogenase/meso-butanediol dehydrogenase/diacetyl reductase